MKKLNMTSLNMLIRKEYLLAGVVMAANMFVVNEMKAMKKMDFSKQKNSILNNQSNATGENINIKDVFYIGP